MLQVSCFKFHASSFMKFLPQNKKTRNKVLLVILLVWLLFVGGFFYNMYFMPTISSNDSVTIGSPTQKALAEQAVKNLDNNILEITKELSNGFYKDLVSHPLRKDAAVAGNDNPFLK